MFIYKLLRFTVTIVSINSSLVRIYMLTLELSLVDYNKKCLLKKTNPLKIILTCKKHLIEWLWTLHLSGQPTVHYWTDIKNNIKIGHAIWELRCFSDKHTHAHIQTYTLTLVTAKAKYIVVIFLILLPYKRYFFH